MDLCQVSEVDLPADIGVSSLRRPVVQPGGAAEGLEDFIIDPYPWYMESATNGTISRLSERQTTPFIGANDCAPAYPLLPWRGNIFDGCPPLDHQPYTQDVHNHATDNLLIGRSSAYLDRDLGTDGLNSGLLTSDSSSILRSTSSMVALFTPDLVQDLSPNFDRPVEENTRPGPSLHLPLTGSPIHSTPTHRRVSTQLPDPWRNSIQFTTTTVLNAFLNIALSLGFNLSDLTGSNCLGSSIQSPFYRPTTPGDNPQALLAAARRPSFPANLQPTLSQILIPHHPFLDLIPFPALRDRAIILAAAVPHLFSMAELKNDVYVHGALVCWVGGPGAQPWDVHSWEAAPWFLRKWRLVVGSEDGELSRTSKWWQDARGA